MVNLLIKNIELVNRLREVAEMWDEPYLTEEEKKYYAQLYKSIYDDQLEVLKEMREKSMEDLNKFFKETELTKLLKIIEKVDCLDPKMRKFNAKIKKWHNETFKENLEVI